jgi:ATP-dependent helicase/nuclease subunit A
VFLADTTSSPGGNPRNPLIAMPVTAADNSTLSVWASSKADDPEPVAAARQNMAREAEDEYRRLLYVAMTRAMERLVVCGCMPGNVNELKPGWWYTLVRDGLAAGVAAEALVEESVTLADAGARIFRAANEAPPDDVRRESGEPPSPVAEPQWLRQDASSEVRAADWLRPSAIDDDDVAAPRRDLSAAARQLAQRRGTLVHRLLQSLPDIAAEQRPLATERFLARNAADWPAPERTALTERVLALIADARFAAVFAPGSRAEVPVIGHIPRSASSPLAITGQIDRLAITATDVLIVDFKTGHAPAGQPEAVPPAYRRQMALYRALLAALYPERNVRAALLWTETPEIMELSSATLDAELTRIRAG